MHSTHGMAVVCPSPELKTRAASHFIAMLKRRWRAPWKSLPGCLIHRANKYVSTMRLPSIVKPLGISNYCWYARPVVTTS